MLRRLKIRQFLFCVGVLLILWAAVAIYQAREDNLTRSLGGTEMPDVSTSQIERIEARAKAQARLTVEAQRKHDLEFRTAFTNELKQRQFIEDLRRAAEGK